MERSRALSERFASEGFAVVPGLFDPAEIAEVRGVLDGLFDEYDRLPAGHTYDLDRRPVDGSLGKIPAIRNALRLKPDLAGSRALVGARALADEILGRDGSEILWDSAVYKPSGGSSETPWHQDEAVYGLSRIRKPRSLLYFWVALDAVDGSNGCLRFVPGSHLGPLLAHDWRNGDTSSSLVLSCPIDEGSGVSVPLGPGDATIHHPRTLHGSGPNLSDRWRKGWILGIGTPSAPRWLRSLKRGVLALRGRSGGD